MSGITTEPPGKAPPTGAKSATKRGVDWTSVIAFTMVAYALGWGCFIGLRLVGVPFGIVSIVGMFAPAGAALIVRVVRSEGFADLGLGPYLSSRRGAYLRSYATAVGLLATMALLVFLLGRQHWAPGIYNSSWPIVVVGALTLDTLITMIPAAGEEVGWRGHLLIRLVPLGPVRASVLVGVIWGIWHAPLIVPGQGWLGALFFCLGTIPLSVILAWLRFGSRSVWPATLAHAALNSGGAVFALLLSSDQWMIAPPAGVIGIFTAALFAAWLIGTHRLQVLGGGR